MIQCAILYYMNKSDKFRKKYIYQKKLILAQTMNEYQRGAKHFIKTVSFKFVLHIK